MPIIASHNGSITSNPLSVSPLVSHPTPLLPCPAGGSCFNLSRGSFEPALRRQRQQQGGSLEDLSAIDESTPGGRGAGLEAAAKSGGSLQNLSQQSGQQSEQSGQEEVIEAAADVEMTDISDCTGQTYTPVEGHSAPRRPDAGGAVVIQMSDFCDDSGDEGAARLAVRALAAPCEAEREPERGTSLQERPRHTVSVEERCLYAMSLEEGGGALQARAERDAEGETLQKVSETELRQVRQGPGQIE